MFCFKCGNQISDDAQFCPKCGVQQTVAVDNATSVAQPESKELAREAIQIYLSNILALECMKLKLNEDYNTTNTKYGYEYWNNGIKCFPIENGNIWLAFHEGQFCVGAFRDGKSGGAYTGSFLNREQMLNGNGFTEYVWGERIIKHRGEFYWGTIDDKSFPTISDSAFWWDIGGDNWLQQKMWQSKAKNAFLSIYSDFKETAPKLYQENYEKTVKPLKDKVDGINEEMQKVDELLESAYSVNIIPQQFRNIHAIWFIHDFITTSGESLTTAFLHCDLDEIKQKLDTIIVQQREIIINQAIIAAQNVQIAEQNQQTLNSLAKIEQNTYKSAQYAQIAANNAEACAWIGLANYINQ